MTSRGNGSFVRFLGKRFAERGFSVQQLPTRTNGKMFYVLSLHRGPRGARPLLLNTHIDTVPPGPLDRWTSTGGNPWRMTRCGALWHGLGVADVKLNLLCQWEALGRLADFPFRRPVRIVATWGEERGLLGARVLLKRWRGPRPELVLVGEPSEGRPILRHRGYLVFVWSLGKKGARPRTETTRVFKGVAAHSSTPHLGVNALEKVLDFFSSLEKKGSGVVVSSLRGGTAPNQVPAEARASWRAVPGTEKSAVMGGIPWREIQGALVSARSSLPPGCSLNWGLAIDAPRTVTLVWDIRFPPERTVEEIKKKIRDIVPEGRFTVEDPALNASPQDPRLAPLWSALRKAGLSTRPQEKLTCTEAGLYHAWGVPAVVWGPGVSTGNVHRPNESISESELARAVDFYERLFREWAGRDA